MALTKHLIKDKKPFGSIRPCPFCGGEGDLFKEPEDYFAPTEMYIRCTRCGARGSFSFNPEEALSLWNKRHGVERAIDCSCRKVDIKAEQLKNTSTDELATSMAKSVATAKERWILGEKEEK